jgi:phosphate-selective porin
MRIASLLTSIALAGFVATGVAAAATTAATTTAPAAATTAAPAKKPAASAMTPEKTAISKQCSALADARKLHGKAREKFRADCKKNGGKAT